MSATNIEHIEDGANHCPQPWYRTFLKPKMPKPSDESNHNYYTNYPNDTNEPKITEHIPDPLDLDLEANRVGASATTFALARAAANSPGFTPVLLHAVQTSEGIHMGEIASAGLYVGRAASGRVNQGVDNNASEIIAWHDTASDTLRGGGSTLPDPHIVDDAAYEASTHGVAAAAGNTTHAEPENPSTDPAQPFNPSEENYTFTTCVLAIFAALLFFSGYGIGWAVGYRDGIGGQGQGGNGTAGDYF